MSHKIVMYAQGFEKHDMICFNLKAHVLHSGVESSIISQFNQMFVNNSEKYRYLSSQCESNGQFINNLTVQPYYNTYNSVFVVLLADKCEQSLDNNQNLAITEENFESNRSERLNKYTDFVLKNAYSYCMLCSFNDSIFDIYDVCVDQPRRRQGHATNIARGCVHFVDFLIKNVIIHTTALFRDGISYAPPNKKYKVDVIIELFVNPKNPGALKAYTNANFIALEDLPSRDLWKVSNFPWINYLNNIDSDREPEENKNLVYMMFEFVYPIEKILTHNLYQPFRFFLKNRLEDNTEDVKRIKKEKYLDIISKF